MATSCDKTLATTVAFTSIRVVCQNTLNIALGAKRTLKIEHIHGPKVYTLGAGCPRTAGRACGWRGFGWLGGIKGRSRWREEATQGTTDKEQNRRLTVSGKAATPVTLTETPTLPNQTKLRRSLKWLLTIYQIRDNFSN